MTEIKLTQSETIQNETHIIADTRKRTFGFQAAVELSDVDCDEVSGGNCVLTDHGNDAFCG